jgi:hypothetical protein
LRVESRELGVGDKETTAVSRQLETRDKESVVERWSRELRDNIPSPL